MIAIAETHQHDIESILRERRRFRPSAEFSRAAHVKSMACKYASAVFWNSPSRAAI